MVSLKTTETYRNAIKRIEKHVGDIDEALETNNGRNTIYEFIDTVRSLNSRTVLYASLINRLKNQDKKVPQEIYDNLKENQINIMKQRREDKKNPPDEDVEKMVTIDEIAALRDEYKQKLTSQYVPTIDIKYLILSLYSDKNLPPLRSQDWYNAKVVQTKDEMNEDDEKEQHNYVILDEGKFIRNTGKTTKVHGHRFIKIPDRVLNDITNFHEKSGSEWLIPNTRNKHNHIEESHFTRLLQRTIQQKYGESKKVSSSMIRKIAVSTKINKIEKMYPDFFNIYTDLNHLAKDMGHTPYIQRTVYGRLSKAV